MSGIVKLSSSLVSRATSKALQERNRALQISRNPKVPMHKDPAFDRKVSGKNLERFANRRNRQANRFNDYMVSESEGRRRKARRLGIDDL